MKPTKLLFESGDSDRIGRQASMRLAAILLALLTFTAFLFPGAGAAETNGTAEGEKAMTEAQTALSAGTQAPAWDTYSDTWTLTDALGRSAPLPTQTSTKREGKYALIFYHIWHSDFMKSTVKADSKAPRNVSAILESNPDARNKKSLWGPEVSYHYWGEPLYGFYNLDGDGYVVRKHAQLLTDAGIDGIVLDYSNYCVSGVHNESNYSRAALTNLLDTYLKIRSEGGRTPGVVLLLTWDASVNGTALKNFYKDFYSKPEYEELWFRWEGKPLVLGQSSSVSAEIADHWTYRRPWPYYTPVDGPNMWSWLSNYPQQPCYTEDNALEMVAVSVAQNWSESLDFMSATDADGNYIAHGRSYTYGGNNKLLNDPVSPEYGSEYGANLQQQFDRALELDPSVLFITGWNEWIAARFLTIPAWARCSADPVPAGGGFCDVFSTEFSRDIEPTRQGGLNDNFYNQLAINIRRFKGTGALPAGRQLDAPAQGAQLTALSCWNDIATEYRDSIGDTALRDADGIGKNHYVNATGRNDFRVMKVFHTAEELYFYAETANEISAERTGGWMTLFIKTSVGSASWEGYNYVVNRTAPGDNALLERSTGGWNWETVSDQIRFEVNGNKLVFAVPLEALGLGPDENLSLEFKWTDNVCLDDDDGYGAGDILKFYENGDTAPGGRFTYLYRSEKAAKKAENKSGDNALYTAMLIGGGVVTAGAVGAAIAVAASSKKKKESKKTEGTEE